MHNAPAVDLPVGRSRYEAWLLLLAWLLACSVVVTWGLTQQRMDWRVMLTSGLVLSAGLAAGWCWSRGSNALLHWDGQQWRLKSDTVVLGRAIVRLDLQDWLLLEFKGESAHSEWIWLDRDTHRGQWRALRRALYAPPCSAADAAPPFGFRRGDP